MKAKAEQSRAERSETTLRQDEEDVMARSFISKQSAGLLGTGAVAVMPCMGTLTGLGADAAGATDAAQTPADRVLLSEYVELLTRKERARWLMATRQQKERGVRLLDRPSGSPHGEPPNSAALSGRGATRLGEGG
jgi:hypothetical protein